MINQKNPKQKDLFANEAPKGRFYTEETIPLPLEEPRRSKPPVIVDGMVPVLASDIEVALGAPRESFRPPLAQEIATTPQFQKEMASILDAYEKKQGLAKKPCNRG